MLPIPIPIPNWKLGNIGTGYFHILTAVALAKEVGNIHQLQLKNPNPD